jgi:hypothetical protein
MEKISATQIPARNLLHRSTQTFESFFMASPNQNGSGEYLGDTATAGVQSVYWALALSASYASNSWRMTNIIPPGSFSFRGSAMPAFAARW